MWCCRAPHRFPLGEGVEALPPEALGEAWGLVVADPCDPKQRRPE
jgi:hypothetical protein